MRFFKSALLVIAVLFTAATVLAGCGPKETPHQPVPDEISKRKKGDE